MVCEYAARNGHLECLKYAHDNGCSWDERVCEYAARNGHLKCLKYAQDNGCPCITGSTKLKKYDVLLDVASTDDETETCSVCFVNIHKIKFLPCNHSSFCIACNNILVDLHSNSLTCPYCRSKVKSNILFSDA